MVTPRATSHSFSSACPSFPSSACVTCTAHSRLGFGALGTRVDGSDPCLPRTRSPVRKADGPSCHAQSRGSGASGDEDRGTQHWRYDEKETVETETPQTWLAGSSFSLKHTPAVCRGPPPFEVSIPPWDAAPAVRHHTHKGLRQFIHQNLRSIPGSGFLTQPHIPSRAVSSTLARTSRSVWASESRAAPLHPGCEAFSGHKGSPTQQRLSGERRTSSPLTLETMMSVFTSAFYLQYFVYIKFHVERWAHVFKRGKHLTLLPKDLSL